MEASILARKPGKVQAIGIMTLVSGILDCIIGIGLLFTLFGIVLGIYSIIVGILEIVYAAKLLPDPITATKPGKYVAIMEIINIIAGSVGAMVIGIISLVFYGDPEVAAYFNNRRG